MAAYIGSVLVAVYVALFGSSLLPGNAKYTHTRTLPIHAATPPI